MHPIAKTKLWLFWFWFTLKPRMITWRFSRAYLAPAATKERLTQEKDHMDACWFRVQALGLSISWFHMKR